MTAHSFGYENAPAASDARARKILELRARALGTQPRASLAVSGGSTPKLTFAPMAKAAFDWSNMHRFWVDERVVPPADSQSNYIRAFLHLVGQLEPGDVPRFDGIHRGMGPDAHTASLFPEEALIDDRKNLVAAAYVERFHQWRVIWLPAVLEAARRTRRLASGDDTAKPPRAVLGEPYNPKMYPAQIATYDRDGGATRPVFFESMSSSAEPPVVSGCAAGADGAAWFLDKPAARLDQLNLGR